MGKHVISPTHLTEPQDKIKNPQGKLKIFFERLYGSVQSLKELIT